MSLIDKLAENSKSGIYPFHMPGHKRRLFPVGWLCEAYKFDTTEVDGYDNLHNPTGVIKEAEEKAAQLFGSDETHFLVNGATSGILAAICGTVGENDRIYVARNCHKSVYNAIMLSKATPVYIYPEMESLFEICGGITADQVRERLSKDKEAGLLDNSRAIAVITSPTYEGIVSDVGAIAEVCHEYGVTLLVDSAHGSHFGFSESFPESAIAQGADIVITSIHKTLPAFTQTALIHISASCNCAARIRKMLTMVQSSSPSYILMAGIEGCIDFLEKHSAELFIDYGNRLDKFYNEAEKLENISVLTVDKLTAAGSVAFDRGKIVISDRTNSLTGKQLYDMLLDKYKIQAEMAAGGYLVLMTSVADDDKGFDRLSDALWEIDYSLGGDGFIPGKVSEAKTEIRSIFERIMTRLAESKIRKILFSDKELSGAEGFSNQMVEATAVKGLNETFWIDETEMIPVELAEGRVAADFVGFYPPGIPIVAPGEILTAEIVDEILKGIDNGLLSDKEICVVCE